MNRKTIDGLVGTLSLVLVVLVANFFCEPALRRLGFDDDNMVNKIVAGTIIGGGVLVLCGLISFVAKRIIKRKDK
jgi:hypothetical protein